MAEDNITDRRRFTAAAREAAARARAAKRALPDQFGNPELFIVRAGGKGFSWELRRFGGMLLKRANVEFSDRPTAETAGQDALTLMRETEDQPSFQRQQKTRSPVP